MRLTDTVRDLKECLKSDLDPIEARLDASTRARGIVESKPMPAHIEHEIRAYYRELCRKTGSENVPVAVRSSGAVSMPGQMETFLNVIGEEAVVAHVKGMGRAYTTRAITFRIDKGLPLEWAPIGVAVMTLIDARSAGVVLTLLPTSGDASMVVIEGNFGLGESVVSGEITPDSFIVNKETMEILERKVVRKQSMVRKGEEGTLYEDITGELQDKPCLEDREIEEIAQTAVQVEKHFGVPQDMEWVVDRNLPPGRNVFWVQARPARYVKAEKTDEIDYLIDLMATLFK